MKLVRLQKKLFERSANFKVGNKRINAFQGYFKISEREKSYIVSEAEKLWISVLERSGVKHFEGHIRFDFIPEFKEKSEFKGRVIDLGDLSIKGIYEINAHSPEGVACDAVYRESFPELRDHTPDATKELAKAFLKAKNGKMVMVQGSNPAKISWGRSFVERLKSYGIEIEVKSTEEVKKRFPKLIWRWGDIDFKEEFNEYDPSFQKWLLSFRDSIKIINTVPESREKDVANKKFLAEKEDIILDNPENLRRLKSVDRKEYVLKPLRGASGKCIVFGEDVKSDSEWKNELDKSYKKGDYGIFKKVLLPKINTNGLSIAMDFLPAFYAYGESLRYLYSLIRLEPWESYSSRKTINVAQGGGYGGTVALED